MEVRGNMRAMVARLWREERGQNMVEMALLLPVLLVLVFGVIEFARGYNYSDQTSQIANETARWIIVDRNDETYGDTAGYRRVIRKYESDNTWQKVFASHGVVVLHKRATTAS